MKGFSRSIRADTIFIDEGEIMNGPDSINEIALDLSNNVCQWSLGVNGTFIPAAKTVKKLIPGVYSMEDNPQIGNYFRKLEVNTSELLVIATTKQT